MYWSWGTTIIWLPTNLFKNRFPSQPISVVCMKKKKDQMKVSISLLTFSEFRHLCKAKLVPFFSEMSNIRVKIELLLAACYTVFSVWFKSQRDICSTIVCNSVIVNLVISSSYESTVQCNARSFYFPNRFHLLQIKKAKIVGFELGKEI